LRELEAMHQVDPGSSDSVCGMDVILLSY